MTKKAITSCILLLVLPQTAWAQDILGIILVFAMIPLLNIVLVVTFSLTQLSGKVLVTHGVLVLSWILLFWLTSSYTDSDFLAWLPVFLSIAHSLLLIYRIIQHFKSSKQRE